MKLAAKYDVEAPASYVFAQLSDFESWERAAMRRGADVMRTDMSRTVQAGMTWATQFHYRSKDRRATIRLDAITPTTAMALTAMSSLLDGVLQIEVLDLAAKRTRIEIKLELKPKTIAARIYIQSLRLARARVERSFAQRVAHLTADIEDRYRRARPT